MRNLDRYDLGCHVSQFVCDGGEIMGDTTFRLSRTLDLTTVYSTDEPIKSFPGHLDYSLVVNDEKGRAYEFNPTRENLLALKHILDDALMWHV